MIHMDLNGQVSHLTFSLTEAKTSKGLDKAVKALQSISLEETRHLVTSVGSRLQAVVEGKRTHPKMKSNPCI